MKKIILFAFLVFFSLGAFPITPDSKDKSVNPLIPDKKENKMSDEETSRLSKRVEEIRNNDKANQRVVVQEGRRSRRGHEGMNGENHRHGGGVIFIGGGGVILLIILIIILV